MIRLVALLIVAVALVPAAALATPSPSPALSTILAPPRTTDFTEAGASNSTLLEGQFDAKVFVTKTRAPNADEVQQTLARDGFIDGYWRTWVQQGTQHVMVEIVMAFTGGDGAKRWLGASELADKGDTSYTKSLSITGIDTYYGARFVYAINHSIGEEFAFVKGNDYFGVIFVSPKDDLGTSTAAQATAQYGAAPDATIPKSQWPESATSSTAYKAGALFVPIIFFVLIAGVILLVAGLVIRSRRRAALAGAAAGAMPVAMYAATPGAMQAAAAPAGPLQMSPDGAYWWDGQAWRDAQREVPPMAQRSPDGAFWWDGQKWRAVS